MNRSVNELRQYREQEEGRARAELVGSIVRLAFLLAVVLYLAYFVTRPLPADLEHRALSEQHLAKLLGVRP